MRILLIGHKVEDQFAALMAREWIRMGHDVIHVSHRELLRNVGNKEGTANEAWFNQYTKFKMPLSMIINEKDHDLIFVVQGILHFSFKTKIPIVYYQFERMVSPSIARPTIILGSYVECGRHIRTFYPWEMSTVEHYETFLECADPALFPNRNCTKDPGVHFIMKARQPVQELYMFNEGLHKHRKLLKIFHDKAKVTIHPEMSYKEYAALMQKQGASLVLTLGCGNLSQRAYECLAAKSIPVIHVENPRLHPYLKKWGFVHGENAWIIETPEEILPFYELSNQKKKKMRQAGYKLLMERHTPAIRAQQILDIVEESGHILEPELLSFEEIIDEKQEDEKVIERIVPEVQE